MEREFSLVTGASARDFPQSYSACFGETSSASDTRFDEASAVPSGSFFEVVFTAPGTNEASIGVGVVLVTEHSDGILQRIFSHNMIFRTGLLVVIFANQTFDVEVTVCAGVETWHFEHK